MLEEGLKIKTWSGYDLRRNKSKDCFFRVLLSNRTDCHATTLVLELYSKLDGGMGKGNGSRGVLYTLILTGRTI